jgi:hypothetical protein
MATGKLETQGRTTDPIGNVGDIVETSGVSNMFSEFEFKVESPTT